MGFFMGMFVGGSVTLLHAGMSGGLKVSADATHFALTGSSSSARCSLLLIVSVRASHLSLSLAVGHQRHGDQAVSTAMSHCCCLSAFARACCHSRSLWLSFAVCAALSAVALHSASSSPSARSCVSKRRHALAFAARVSLTFVHFTCSRNKLSNSEKRVNRRAESRQSDCQGQRAASAEERSSCGRATERRVWLLRCRRPSGRPKVRRRRMRAGVLSGIHPAEQSRRIAVGTLRNSRWRERAATAAPVSGRVGSSAVSRSASIVQVRCCSFAVCKLLGLLSAAPACCEHF